MRKIYLLIIATFFYGSLLAQIHVDSFEKLSSGEALTNQKKDHNGEVCALIKITTNNLDETQRKRIVFYTDQASQILDITYPVGAVQFYISPKAEFLEIAHPDLSVTKYVFKDLIESKRDYAMVISTDKVTTLVTKSITEAFLAIIAQPAEAEIYIDNVFAGIGEASKLLSIFEEHTWRVELSLYHTQEGKVKLSEKDTKELNINLLPAFGYLDIRTSPENGAQVIVDGKNIGTSPVKSDPLASGTHSVKVLKEMFQPVIQEITVTEGKTETITIEMPANFSEPTFTTDADAEIWINNERKGVGKWSGRLAAGNYLVETRKASHRTHQETITLKLGEKPFISLNAPIPIYGFLAISTIPIGASIILDGKEIGKTPKIISEILIGTHSITLSKSGYQTLYKTIVIKESEQENLTETLKETVVLKNESKNVSKTITQNKLINSKNNGWKWIIGINGAISLTINSSSCELFVGYVKKAGFYLKLKSNFVFKPTAGLEDISSLPDETYFTVHTTTTERIGILGGTYVKLAKLCYWYIGAGYGSQQQILDGSVYTWGDNYTSDNYYNTYYANKFNFLEVETGFTFVLKNGFSMSVGAACIKNYFEAHVGVGWCL